jgi:hypothetical protein
VAFGWLILGLFIYFGYSVKHSKVQKMLQQDADAMAARR